MRRELIAAASVLALMTGTALAQSTTSGTVQNQPAPAGSTVAPGSSAASGTLDMASAEKLIGKNVYGKDNEKIGEVEDIILDSASGQAKQLVISSGGFLGIGEKQIALDYNQAKWNPQDDRLHVATLGRNDVKNMPEFKYTDTTTSMNRNRRNSDVNNPANPANPSSPANANQPAGDAARVQPKQ